MISLFFWVACITKTENSACKGLCDSGENNNLYQDDTGQTALMEPSTEDTSAPTETNCIPNHDGIIERNEYPAQIGLQAAYLLSQNTNVDLVGTTGNNNESYWDLSQQQNSSDQNVTVHLQPIEDFWFAEDFLDGEYVNVLSYSNEIYGIFSLHDDGVYLHGMASFASGWTESKLTYDPPVPLLSFPMQQNTTWQTSTTVTGFLDGVWAYYDELYESSVDSKGILNTPMGEFPVLRINTKITRTIGFLEYTNRSVTFMSECAGSVTTIQSQLDETSVNFSSAQEMLRIVP